MIKHLVFFKLADSAEGKTKAEIALYLKAELEHLKNLIPQVRMLEVGINLPNAPIGNFDLVLNSDFESMADLDLYQNHPEHKRVGAYIAKVKTDRACVDYAY